MLFNSFQFAVFFALVLVLHRTLPAKQRNGLLLAASLIFYGLWVPAYLVLLLAEIGVNYALLRSIATGSRKRLALGASICVTLGLLGFFKYAALAVETIAPALRAGFGFDPPLPEIFLPLGISFFSFQMLSLAIDVYRGEIEAPRTPGRYALYISFFPQLIAGPILRGKELLPQLASGARPTPERSQRGLWLIGSGLVKKVLLADFLLAPFANEVFLAPGVASPAFHWIAVFSFAFQIYYDFSGYTDIARGLALLLGFELPENFHEPYLSRSPQEFWQRWHMTLSRWLSLYLFIPISRALLRRTPDRFGGVAVALTQLVTMALCGLWHGAGWHFVVWGVLQGVLLAVWPARRGRRHQDPVRWSDVPAILLFFNVYCLTLVFFRASSFGAANEFLFGMLGGGASSGWPVFQTGVVVLCAALHVAERTARIRAPELRAALAGRAWGPVAQAAALGGIVGLAIAVAGAGGEFIYFQF